MKSERTALMWAVQGGNMKMISFLLKQGANPNTKGQVGMTSLIYVDHEDPFMEL
nr:ankyrin repeat domain-containing protein [Leptospira interrogans]